ncbi:hypothetical protein [Brachybacterium huguangmaarense]
MSTTTSTTGRGTTGPGATAPGSRPAGGADELHQEVPRRPRDFGVDTASLRRMRLVAFAILALPLLALGLLAAKFVSMPITQSWSLSAYRDGDYPGSIERLGPVEFANWFEPYLPHLTRGTDLLQEGKNAEAEKELRVALDTWTNASDLNQPMHAQCKILNNLAISIERQADQIDDAKARGDRLYEAEQLLAPCAGGGGGGDGQGGGSGQGSGSGQGNEDEGTTDENRKRIEEKRKGADEESGTDRGDQEGQTTPQDQENPSNDPVRQDPSGEERTQPAPTQGPGSGKEGELDERNKGANSGDGSSSDGPPGDPSKPW